MFKYTKEEGVIAQILWEKADKWLNEIWKSLQDMGVEFNKGLELLKKTKLEMMQEMKGFNK